MTRDQEKRRDNFMRLAHMANVVPVDHFYVTDVFLEKFAEMVTAEEREACAKMNIKPTAWMQELPKEEGVDRAVRTTTVKEVADDWEQAIPLYTADDLRTAVLAEREAVGNIILDYAERDDLSNSDESLLKHLFELIRTRGET